ncbi:MATE efflux family [Micractinium conductrix]|uniref:Protein DETOXIFICATION n=1 Tax=Micractinium conductrix TaxID=554055 RepID=A0A2P6V7U3_9CHLO|nr:MATE efflux family [Micractinium conductrix]|eukprot:PSC70154.1 MATE efflux family [Micractinium conductrix]
MIAIAFVGRLGEDVLSVVVLATSIYNVTGLAVLIGFASAMETFCSQAMGAGRPHLLGLVLQRALLLLSLLAAAVAACWTQVEPLLLALGQDPAIAHGTARFMLRATPALLFTAIFEAQKRYLMAQEAVRPATVVTAIALCLSPLYNWILIFKLGCGVYGAAYALDLTQATLALLLGAYCVARDRLLAGSPLATWHGLSRQAWQGWGQYCRFALPSVAMLCCEWSTFEVMVLMSGLLPDPAVSVSAMGLAINTSGLSYMAVTGLACATSVRAGHALGAGRPGDARRATWTAWRLTMCQQVVLAGGIVLARNSWPHIFTDSPPVVARTAQLLPLFALSLFGDGTNAVLQGLLRGAGRQHLGAVTNLLSYWCCGIPLAAYLAFRRGLGLEGLWWGLVCINTVQGGIMLTLAWRFDFEGQAEHAMVLLQQAAAARGAGGNADPLLHPLLPGGADGEAGRRGAGPGGTGRRRGGSPDGESIKRRLSKALLLLLTEGAPQRRGPGGTRARRVHGVAPA